jgi:hypothetical protein
VGGGVNGSHYVVDGQSYVRVTTVCGVLRKPFLESWIGRVGNAEAARVRKESTEFGTRLHAALQAFATDPTAGGWTANLAPDLEPHAEAFLGWWWANVAQVIAPERLLVSRQFGYAGTTDLVCVLKDGATAIVDWKSSKAWPRGNPQPDPSWRIQTAAYAQALHEQDGIEATRRLVVQLPNDQAGSVYIHPFDAASQAADFLTFRSLLFCYRWQEGLKG